MTTRLSGEPTIIGLISDTHGLLRPEVLDALAGVSLIVHAGDVGRGGILDRLGELAPVVAVRGNNDVTGAEADLPVTQLVEAAGIRLLVTHELADALASDAHALVRVVVTGHSHRPGIDERDGKLFVNPGSAGPRRFRLPVTVARLSVVGSSVEAQIISLIPTQDRRI